MEKYTVSGFVFDTKEEALAARRELNAVQTICQKLDVSNPKYAKAVYHRVIEKQMFHTIVGEEFLKSLALTFGEETEQEPQSIPEPVSEPETVSEPDSIPEPETVSESESESESVNQPELKEQQPESIAETEQNPETEEAGEEEPLNIELPVESQSDFDVSGQQPDLEISIPQEDSKETLREEEVFNIEDDIKEEWNNKTPEDGESESTMTQDIIIDAKYFEDDTESLDSPETEQTDAAEEQDKQLSEDNDKQNQDTMTEDEPSDIFSDDMFVTDDAEVQEEVPEWKRKALEALYEDEKDSAKKRKKEKAKNTEEDYQSFKDDYEAPAEEEPEEDVPENRHYRGLFFNSFVLNIVLIVAVVVLFLVAFNSENANILNYERVLNNQYQQMEKQLQQEYESMLDEIRNGAE